MRVLLLLLLIGVCALPVRASAQTATPSPTSVPLPTPTVTPTAIPTVVLDMSAIITSTTGVSQQLADFSSGPDSNLFLFLAAIVIGFWSFTFIKEFMTWRISDQ